MITAGIDIGAKTIKIVILKDGGITARHICPAGYDVKESLEKSWDDLQVKTGYCARDVQKIAATGIGRQEIPGDFQPVAEVDAAARGGRAVDPAVRTVIDVGAEEGRAVKIKADGRVIDFVVNEKCAAGAGAFTEAMARALEVRIEELGPLSLHSTQTVAMNAQCVVFAESELVSLIHSLIPKSDIARAVHEAIAERIVSMVRRIGLEPKVMLIGGLAHNTGFTASLKHGLNSEIIVPEDPEFIGAYGAALIAADPD